MASEANPAHDGPGEAEGEAEVLRSQGNDHFKAQRHEEAAECYRQALRLLNDSVGAASAPLTPLGQAVRLNLAACLQRLGADPEESVQLCSEVLAADPLSAKAFFRRGLAQRDAARAAADAASKRDALVAARRDLREAARLEPSDRQLRAQLDEVADELKALGGAGLGLGGLYDDREIQEPPPPPVVCSNCGREGHPLCGRALWVAQRAAWLGMPVSEVDRDPPSFEDDGTLRAAIRAARGEGAENAAGTGPGESGASDSDALADLEADGESLSETEYEMLEDCLCAIDRPYPQLKRKLALPRAVRCAEQLWDEVG